MIPFERRHAKWVNIRRPDDCWLWTGKSRTSNGDYGQTSLNGRHMGAHVATYKTFKGDVPPGMVVRHSCDHGLCCNPAHLVLGTQADNRRDAVERGRQARGERINTAQITADTVRLIRRDLASGHTVPDIARRLDIASKIIHRIRWGETWRHVTQEA